jgi:cytoskeletal protein CcmA (bactofilin family)
MSGTFTNYTLIYPTIDPANSGQGDPIRTAFGYVNENFANIQLFLNQQAVGFNNANISGAANVGVLNSTTVNSTQGTIGTLNVTTLVANNTSMTGNLAVTGRIDIAGNLIMASNIIPAVAGTYDIGTPTIPFRNLYVQTTVSTSQITQSSDAGLLIIHANANPGDVQDVGVFGNVSSKFGTNTYAFFGHEYQTDTLVFKMTNNNAATVGNGVVYDGIDSKVRFGSLTLSNVTPTANTTTGALVVAGGVGIGGELNVAGNITSNGAIILTTDIFPSISGTLYVGGPIFGTNVVIAAPTPSTSTLTGALVVPFGGIGVVGNVYSSGGFYGPLFGTIQTANQPLISNVGTLSNLTVAGTGIIQVGQSWLDTGSLITGNISASNGTINFSSAQIKLLSSNIDFNSASLYNINNLYSPRLFGANIVANATTAATGALTGALQSYGGAWISGNLFVGNATNGTSAMLFTNSNSVVQIGAVPVTQSGIAWTPSGVGAVSVGSTAGYAGQGAFGVAIGSAAATKSQGNSAIAVGTFAGNTGQGAFSVAVGTNAGFVNQGAYSVAVGPYAGTGQTAANSIIINASTTALNSTDAGLYIAPVRNDTTTGFTLGNVVTYNVSTKELTYSNTIAVQGNVQAANLNSNAAVNGTSVYVTNGVFWKANSAPFQANINRIFQGTSNVAVSASFVNVSVSASNVGSFSARGLLVPSTTDSVIIAKADNGVAAFVANASGSNFSHFVFANVGLEQNRITSIPAGNNTGGALVFSQGNGLGVVERMRIDTGGAGNVLIGAASASANGVVVVGFTTAAANIYSGAMRVSGGVGIEGNIYGGGIVSATGNIVAAANLNVIGTGSVNVTSTGNVNVAANVNVAGNLRLTGSLAPTAGGNINIAGNLIPFGSNALWTLGSVNSWFGTIYGVSVQALYADLAENYVADADYEAGTVVIFGGTEEITTTTIHADARVAGAVSTNPAYHMNAANPGIPVALRGRVPVKVVGPVTKGDSLVTSDTPGYAVSVGTDRTYGQSVFAKSLDTNLDEGAKIITAVIL